MGISSNPDCFDLIQHSAVGLGKTAEDDPGAWVPSRMWESWKKLLAPGFRSAQAIAAISEGTT